MANPDTASPTALLLTAYRKVTELADTHARTLDEACRTMLASAWVGGGAPRFSEELIERRKRVQTAFERALEEIAQVLARLGETPPRPHRVVSPVAVMTATPRAFAGMDIAAMRRLAAELDRAGHSLPEAGSALHAACAAVGVAAGAGRVVGEVGVWAAAQARDLRRRMEIIERRSADPFATGVKGNGKGGDLAPAALVGFGLFGAFVADRDGAGALLTRAQAGDVDALREVVDLQKQGEDASLAGRVNAWWQMLDPAARQKLIKTAPGVVGSLNGLPSATRDSANRTFLAWEETRVRTELALLMPVAADLTDDDIVDQAAIYINLLARVEAVKAALAEGGRNGQPPALLLAFDSNGQGRAVVSYGDPDTAHHVTTYVPGFSTTIEGGRPDFQRSLTTWRRAERLKNPGERIASIAWLGYDAPQLGQIPIPGHSVLADGAAEKGAKELVSFADGLRASHDPNIPANSTMVGHSYGSLTTAKAAVQRPFGRFADDLVFVGSPGLGVEHARDLGIDPNHVWVGAARDDDVAQLGHFGAVPHSPEFGAKVFHVDTSGHSNYWRTESDSLRNIGSIIAGTYHEVKLKQPPDIGLLEYLRQKGQLGWSIPPGRVP